MCDRTPSNQGPPKDLRPSRSGKANKFKTQRKRPSSKSPSGRYMDEGRLAARASRGSVKRRRRITRSCQGKFNNRLYDSPGGLEKFNNAFQRDVENRIKGGNKMKCSIKRGYQSGSTLSSKTGASFKRGMQSLAARWGVANPGPKSPSSCKCNNHGKKSKSKTRTPPPPPPKKEKTRCDQCRKKTGLLGFKCRCGGNFCSAHRYDDGHNCNYDHKAAGKIEIAKNNPKVIGEKIRKI